MKAAMTCADCGRVGTRGFVRSSAGSVCDNVNACKERRGISEVDRLRAERDALARTLDRIQSHSKVARLIVEDAKLWVATDGQQGKRFGEK